MIAVRSVAEKWQVQIRGSGFTQLAGSQSQLGFVRTVFHSDLNLHRHVSPYKDYYNVFNLGQDTHQLIQIKR